MQLQQSTEPDPGESCEGLDTRAGFHSSACWTLLGGLQLEPSLTKAAAETPSHAPSQSLDGDWMGTQTGLKVTKL